MAGWVLFTPERVEMLLNAAALEIPKAVATLALAGLGWIIGKKLSIIWSREQKRREQDLIVARDFHQAYGQFFATWKQWNYFLNGGTDLFPGASRWSILQEACKAEATLESTFVRLASERQLSQHDVEALGRFRQIFQHLRESIRDGLPLAWNSSEHPTYAEFKMLAPRVAAIIGTSKVADESSLMKITTNMFENGVAMREKPTLAKTEGA